MHVLIVPQILRLGKNETLKSDDIIHYFPMEEKFVQF
jgi:hypothetical protein